MNTQSNLLMLLILILFFLSFPVTSSTATSYEKITFDASLSPNMHDMEFEGDAYSTNEAIQLTTNQRDKSLYASLGRVTYREPMHLWDKVSGNLADFSTHFSFGIDSQNQSMYADGFAFFLATNGSKLRSRSEGGGLGLLNRDQTENYYNYSFVAVEFDTFQNVWDFTNRSHLGIDVRSMQSVNIVDWTWSDIKNGRRAEVLISYNSSSKNLSVLLVDAGDEVSFPRNSSHLYSILDLRDYLPEWVTFGFSGATGDKFETHSIYSWNFSSSLQVAGPSPSIRISSNKGLVLVLAVGDGALAFVLLVFCLVWFFGWMRRNRSEKQGHATYSDVEIEGVRGPREFSFKELVAATNNFADDRLLGEGGFGRVYLGFLRDMNSNVAVKRITPQSEQGIKEYASELKSISQLSHRNLVKLIGWCHERHQFIIVYEFMLNKSLNYHLFEEPVPLTWEKRYNIALGLASALFYLQEECEQCVLHRDIKSSNILLDSNFNAKLGDFGLARLVDHGHDSQTTVLFGTEGYVAPEYRESSKATKKSDMYSFGIVALEIACGKKATGGIKRLGKKFTMKLVDWVWELYGTASIHAAADSRLGDDYDVEQMECLIGVGLACAQPNPEDRPSIRQALDMLNFKEPLPVLPREMPLPEHVATHLADVYANAGYSSKVSTSTASSNTASNVAASPTASNTTQGITCSTG